MTERDGKSSPAPTAVDERKDEANSINEEFRHRFFPGLDEQAKDKYLVEFEPDDPLNPKNWSSSYRWFLTMLSGFILLNAYGFCVVCTIGDRRATYREIQLVNRSGDLTISLFVVGYCIGPIFWGSLSEQIGRRPIFVVSFIFYTGFQVGCALSQNAASILIFRLLAGTFAAAPMTNSGAFISDMWDADMRGKAMALFTIAPLAGPCLGPIVGGYINQAGVSWRWLFWVSTLFAGSCTIAIIFLIPEIYEPIIMASKAKALRLRTGDDRYYAPIERQPKKGWGKHLQDTVARPFKILFQEPMLLAITMYMSFIYGCLYLLFEAYPVVFQKGHGSLLVIVAITAYLMIFNPRYLRLIEKYNPHPVPPEARLEVAFVGAPIFALGFFWFAWTSFPSISFWAPMLSGLAMGSSVVFLFLALFNYMIDAYLYVAASALAGSTVVRSTFGAAFPLFATKMYDKLGARWASTLVGGIAVIMIPIPLVLRRYGVTLRKHSKHAPTIPAGETTDKSEA